MIAPLRSLEAQLHDAMSELEHHYSHTALDEKPSSIAEYDHGAAVAESLIEVAKRIALLADAIAAQRATYRGDFVSEMAEKEMRDEELYGLSNHHFIKESA